MSDPEVRKERRLRLPFMEIRVQTVDWFGTLPMAGILLFGFSVAEQDWGLAAVGAVATAFGIWLMSRRLRHADARRKAAWIAIDLGLSLAAVGLAVALSGSWWFWVVLVGGVLLAPAVANRLIPEPAEETGR